MSLRPVIFSGSTPGPITAGGNVSQRPPSSASNCDDAPVTCLVAADETNNDATNFWMFSEAGLRRILHRCGWEVLDFLTLGNTDNSDPATAAGDERAFCYVRSRHF
jgi:hypothetical protein